MAGDLAYKSFLCRELSTLVAAIALDHVKAYLLVKIEPGRRVSEQSRDAGRNIGIPGQIVFVCEEDFASLRDVPNLWRGACKQGCVDRARRGVRSYVLLGRFLRRAVAKTAPACV